MPRQRINSKTRKKEWYARVSVNGTTREKKAGSKREAKEIEVQLRKELTEEFSKKSNPNAIITLQDLWATYLQHAMISKLSKSSIIAKKLAFQRLFRNVSPKLKVDEFRKSHIVRHLHQILTDGTSEISANRDIRHMKRAYNWAIDNELITCPNPLTRLKLFKTEQTERRVLTYEEFKAVLASCKNEQDYLMLIVFINTGARLREVLGLRWSDVDLDNSKVRLWTGKRSGGREGDWVAIDARTTELLMVQRRTTGFMDYVFINPITNDKYDNRVKFFKRLASDANIDPFTAHSIRHLAATLMIHRHESLSSTQRFMRHTTPVVTTRYIHDLTGTEQPKAIAEVMADLLGNSDQNKQVNAQVL